ncbi:MAG TPA: tyrosine-type recombinase/integrase [Beijerinckiaceae bacterium]|nr:tyrosine-type recombinase/integrase [Beijerinckiaceae bacterium]
MGLKEAREAGRDLLARFESGAPALTPAPHPRSGVVLTLGGLLDRYEKLRLREGHRIKTLGLAMRTLRSGLKPWLNLAATEFSKSDLRAARDVVVERGCLFQANRLVGYLSPVLAWAANEDLVPTNFARDLRKSPEAARDRVLSHGEIAAIWHAAADDSFGRLVRFLLATAQRRSEVAALRYGDIIDGVWRQRDNKASRPLILPLPPLALDLVGQGAPQDFVFPGPAGGRMVNFSRAKDALDNASGVEAWRLHDLRRTAATGLQDIGVRADIIGGVLNHAPLGVGAVYLRSELESGKRAALLAWANEIERLVAPKTRAVA